MLYQAYEFQRQLSVPLRMWANTLEQVYSSPYNPWAETWFGKSIAAGAEIMTRLTQNYGKPAFGLKTTTVGDELGNDGEAHELAGAHPKRARDLSLQRVALCGSWRRGGGNLISTVYVEMVACNKSIRCKKNTK